MVAWAMPAIGIMAKPPMPAMPPPTGVGELASAAITGCVADVGATGGEQTTTGHAEAVGTGRGPVPTTNVHEVGGVTRQAERFGR